jgi:hypothetical protein
MTFTPIGSQTNGKNKISKKSNETSHIAQNIGDIQYITGSIGNSSLLPKISFPDASIINSFEEGMGPLIDVPDASIINSFEEGMGPQFLPF